MHDRMGRRDLMARIAHSLAVLRSEINLAYPQRSNRSDGWIGDPDHASRASRHNPNAAGVVCAIDITHDPAHGCDIHAIARRLVLDPHPDLEYVISNGEVAKRRTGFQWEPYRGNPHDKHAHFAVGRGPDSEPTEPYDSDSPWRVGSQEDDVTDQDKKDIIDGVNAHTDARVNAAAEATVVTLVGWIKATSGDDVDVDEEALAAKVVAAIGKKLG